jgi:hypothetical protein
MGGPGIYDRDVTSNDLGTARGTTSVSEQALSRQSGDKALFPMGRKLICQAENPLAVSFDQTGSMDAAPKIFWDKAPLFVGQVITLKLLDDPMISLAAHGDIVGYESAPLQFCDFARLPEIDEWLPRLYLEGHGGAQSRESYELVGYFYAYRCEMPKAKKPFFFFYGDEDYRDVIKRADLRERFGVSAEADLFAEEVFVQLKKNFKGNVFFVRRSCAAHYGAARDAEIMVRWQNLLGHDHVLPLNEDKAITDVLLGRIAIVNGKMTLDEYCINLTERGQSKSRVANVRQALAVLKSRHKGKSDNEDEEEGVNWL